MPIASASNLTKDRTESPAPAIAPESDSDDPSTATPPNLPCKRNGCNTSSNCGGTSAELAAQNANEPCVYHPGRALFHEGTKGWTCCKKRVLEFDEFMRIPGCKTRPEHCYIGKRAAKKQKDRENGHLEKIESVRNDFYQTPNQVHASFYLKKIDKQNSTVQFGDDGSTVLLDLMTSDSRGYHATIRKSPDATSSELHDRYDALIGPYNSF